MRKKACLFVLLALATACNRDPAVPTAEENRQLDDAANMLRSSTRQSGKRRR